MTRDDVLDWWRETILALEVLAGDTEELPIAADLHRARVNVETQIQVLKLKATRL